MKIQAKYTCAPFITHNKVYDVLFTNALGAFIQADDGLYNFVNIGNFYIIQEEAPMTRIEDVVIEVPLHMLTAMAKVCGKNTINETKQILSETPAGAQLLKDVKYIDIHVGDTYYQRAIALLDKAHEEYNSQFVVVSDKKYVKADYEAALASIKAY